MILFQFLCANQLLLNISGGKIWKPCYCHYFFTNCTQTKMSFWIPMLRRRFLHIFFKNMQDNKRYSNYVKSPMCRKSVPRRQNAKKDLYLRVSRDFFQKKQIALEEQEFLQSIIDMHCCPSLSAVDWCQIKTLTFEKPQNIKLWGYLWIISTYNYL